MKTRPGFTVLEIMISVAILVVIATIVLASYTSFRSLQTYSNTLSETTAFIEKARSLSLSSRDGGVYGIHFTATSITRFRGPVYSMSDPKNEVLTFDSSISATSIVLTGGGQDLVFKKVTGSVENYGTTTLEQAVSPVRTAEIIVTRHGIIEIK